MAMRHNQQNPQQFIASMMCEDFDMSQTGNGMAAQTSVPPPDENTDMMGRDVVEDEEQFTDDDMQIAKRFIELMGGVERARELIDKLGECEDCLGIIDDEGDDDCDTIEAISAMVPMHPDMPTGKSIEMSTLYNPTSMQSAY